MASPFLCALKHLFKIIPWSPYRSLECCAKQPCVWCLNYAPGGIIRIILSWRESTDQCHELQSKTGKPAIQQQRFSDSNEAHQLLELVSVEVISRLWCTRCFRSIAKLWLLFLSHVSVQGKGTVCHRLGKCWSTVIELWKSYVGSVVAICDVCIAQYSFWTVLTSQDTNWT